MSGGFRHSSLDQKRYLSSTPYSRVQFAGSIAALPNPMGTMSESLIFH